MSDALRFSLQSALERHGIALATHRPSRALEAEPAARTLLTLARLAHPLWGMRPSPADVSLALTRGIGTLGPGARHLLSASSIRRAGAPTSWAALATSTTRCASESPTWPGEAYDRLRDWLYAYRAEPIAPLDQFFARLFGEVLSQPGFGFHDDYDAARVANQMV